MQVRAKFRCSYVTKFAHESEEVRFDAVYAADGPNKTWSEYTPSGALSMTITAKGAIGVFQPGKEYFLDFTPAEEKGE